MALSRTKTNQRNNILKTAQALFYDKGINETTVKEIAQEANVDRKTFYNYFSSKEEIVDVIFQLAIEENQLIFDISTDNKTGFKQLEEYLDLIFEQFLSKKGMMLMSAYYDNLHPDTPYFLGVDSYQNLMKEKIYQIIEMGVEDGSITTHGLPIHKFIVVMFVPFFSGMQKFFRRESVFNNLFDTEMKDMKTYISLVTQGMKTKN